MIVLNSLLCGALFGQSAATAVLQSDTKPSPGTASAAAAVVASTKEADPQTEAMQKWGVRVSALRLTAADMMLDLRIRVLDKEKAQKLFTAKNKPLLINPATGHKLEVPNGPTTGSLRPTRVPEANRDYAVLFSNAYRQLRRGDKVMVQIGDFQADVTVE